MATGRQRAARPRSQRPRRVARKDLTLLRRRHGKGFTYKDESGATVRDKPTLARIRALAIPPAYEDVRIAPDANAHLQATGRDDAGRLQYIYHDDWTNVRETQKAEHLADLCAGLARLRRRLDRDLRHDALTRERVLAALVMLIDRTHIRIGCDDYVHSGRSRGASTLLKRHVHRRGDRVTLRFHGKRRQLAECEVEAPALARTVADLLRLPGQRLFQYVDENGGIAAVRAADVNGYLQAIVRAPVTAKDFRTLAATAIAAERLAMIDPDPRPKHRRAQVHAVMVEIAEMLGNTPTVVRKSYVHRRLIDAFAEDRLRPLHAACRGRPYLRKREAMVQRLFAGPAAERRKPLRARRTCADRAPQSGRTAPSGAATPG